MVEIDIAIIPPILGGPVSDFDSQITIPRHPAKVPIWVIVTLAVYHAYVNAHAHSPIGTAAGE
jgi:hypothetical protein